jgi:hypothetical protein
MKPKTAKPSPQVQKVLGHRVTVWVVRVDSFNGPEYRTPEEVVAAVQKALTKGAENISITKTSTLPNVYAT